MQRVPVLRLPAILDMERKIPSRESPRRLSAKPGRGTEMKKLARPLGVVAADSDKDSGFSVPEPLRNLRVLHFLPTSQKQILK
uniref:CLOCK interacting protein, circadian n=1 Tax=Mus musculus TaxID=10090 RepID=A0A087WRF0_MOUSE